MRRAVVIVVVLWAALSAVGCASGVSSGRSACPDDFAMSLYVPSPEAAWYVLDADGTLRAATGMRSESSSVPPPVRTLTPRQVQNLWRAVRNVTARPKVDAPEPHAELWIAGNGRRRLLHLPANDGNIAGLANSLRDLAWASR